jgi:hypothetical protein
MSPILGYELALAGAVFSSASWVLSRRRREGAASGAPVLRPPERPAPPAFWVAVVADAAALRARWRAAAGVLLVRSPVAPRLRSHGSVQVDVARAGVRVALHGVAVAVHRADDHFHVEFRPDAAGVRALHRLLDDAERARFRPRAPRFRLTTPAVALAGQREVYATTLSVSQGGCSLRWAGPPPAVGDVLRLRLGASLREVTAAFEVRWVESEARRTSVGLEVVRATADRWQAWAELASAGLPGA